MAPLITSQRVKPAYTMVNPRAKSLTRRMENTGEKLISTEKL